PLTAMSRAPADEPGLAHSSIVTSGIAATASGQATRSLSATVNATPPANRPPGTSAGSIGSAMAVSPSVAGAPPATALARVWPASSKWSRPTAPAGSGALHATLHARVTIVTLPAV